MSFHSMLFTFVQHAAIRSKKPTAAFLASVVLLFSVPAQAQLYAREAPANSAFVRVFNNTAGSGVNVKVDDSVEPPLLAYTAGAYVFLPEGEHSITANTHQRKLKLVANHYYTMVESAGGLEPFELSGALSQLKSMIAIFNLIPDVTLALKTTDAKISVFDSIAPSGSAQRDINPLKLNLAIFNGDQKLADAPPVSLARGKVYSLFATGSQTSPVLIWNED